MPSLMILSNRSFVSSLEERSSVHLIFENVGELSSMGRAAPKGLLGERPIDI